MSSLGKILLATLASLFTLPAAHSLQFSMDDLMAKFFSRDLGCPPIVSAGASERELQIEIYNSSNENLCKQASSAWNISRSSETPEEKIGWLEKSMQAYQEYGDQQGPLSAVLALINTDTDFEYSDQARIWPLRIASAADLIAGTEYDVTMNRWLLASPMTPVEAQWISIAAFLFEFPDSVLKSEAEQMESQAFRLFFARELAISKTLESNLNATLFDIQRAKKKQLLTRYVRLQPVVNAVCKYFADRNLGPDVSGNCKIDAATAKDYLSFLRSLYKKEETFQALIADYVSVSKQLAVALTEDNSANNLPDVLFQNSSFGLRSDSRVNRSSIAKKLKSEAASIAKALK